MKKLLIVFMLLILLFACKTVSKSTIYEHKKDAENSTIIEKTLIVEKPVISYKKIYIQVPIVQKELVKLDFPVVQYRLTTLSNGFAWIIFLLGALALAASIAIIYNARKDLERSEMLTNKQEEELKQKVVPCYRVEDIKIPWVILEVDGRVSEFHKGSPNYKWMAEKTKLEMKEKIKAKVEDYITFIEAEDYLSNLATLYRARIIVAQYPENLKDANVVNIKKETII